MAAAEREQWGTRLGFILAAVGSAVGLGNMWRFSYLAAENGGAAFMLLYLLMTLLIGLPVLLAELVIGRGARRSPVAALRHFGGTRFAPLGWLFVASGLLILSYYSVIAGWTLRYAVQGVLQGFTASAKARFDEVATGPDAVVWHLGFMLLTYVVVSGGIRHGIERMALWLMPALFLIVAGLAIYAATLEGSAAGYADYLQADFHHVFSVDVLTDAAGQAFFSLSLGMGAMLTFASYLGRDDHLPNESLAIAAADFAVAFVAGLVVFPLIAALDLQQEVGESTVGALFITLPRAFFEMALAGRIVGVLFFAALAVGAVTSAISLLEVVVSSAIDGLAWSRARASRSCAGLIGLLGVPAALDLRVLDWMDRLAGNLFLVVGSLGLAIFVGWKMDDPIAEARKGAEGIPWFFLWRTLLRYVVPVVLVIVLYYAITGVLSA